MIFFCEDCGTRNSLTDEYIKQGIVEFRCKSCNYLNSYPLPGTERQSKLEIPQPKKGTKPLTNKKLSKITK
ncbi:MAG: hypothetical protein HQK64_04820 [Desulfamplus sp.]|nr:hypothetical protein [Desulfamplus sp.]MBF0241786.1 hypothetical protein [Desulfamplus sp.]